MKHYKILLFLLAEGFASWLAFISVATYAGYELGASATEVATIMVAWLLPYALFGRIFKYIVGRYNERSILIVITALEPFFAALLFFADSVLGFCIILLFRSSARGAFMPAVAAFASSTNNSGDGNRSKGSLAATIGLTDSLSRVAAPAVGGVIGAYFGESFVFASCGVLAVFALPFAFALPKADRHEKKVVEPPEQSRTTVKELMLLLVFPVLFVSGVSGMYSNLLPYSFSFYDISKEVLSFSISAAAFGAIISNIVLARLDMSVSKYPAGLIFISWAWNSLLFVAVAYLLPKGSNTLLLIPLLFFFVSSARALFNVSLSGYIFSLGRAKAVSFSSLRQSLTAGTAIGLTFVGSTAMEFTKPVTTIMVCAVATLILAVVWYSAVRVSAQVELSSSEVKTV